MSTVVVVLKAGPQGPATAGNPGGAPGDVQINVGGTSFGGVSPGAAGNVFTSNGTAWTSVPPAPTADGANLGAGAQVYKDVTSGTLEFRTLTTTGTLLPSQTQSATEINLRPLPPGWVNVIDYGAVPTAIGSHPGGDDCTAAFIAAIHAASVANPDHSSEGFVFVPPAGDGLEYYIAGATSDLCPFPVVEISRGVRIVSTNNGFSPSAGARIKLGPLCAGFRPVGFPGSSDGGDGGGATLEGLHIVGTQISGTSIQKGWKSSHAYSVGDKIRPHRFKAYYYECFVAGTSSGSTPSIGDCSQLATTAIPQVGNRWRPGKTYAPGDKIHVNTQCGWTFTCSVGGTTNGQNYGSGEATTELAPAIGRRPSCGEPDWFDNPNLRRSSAFTTVTEVEGPTWTKGEADPEPLWESDEDGSGSYPCLALSYQPSHAYSNGAHVFATGRHDVIFIASVPRFTTALSGGSEPAQFATAVSGDNFVVGGIHWYCIPPIGIVNDNGVIWAARPLGAVWIHANGVKIKNCFIENHVCAAITITSDIGPSFSMLSDFWHVDHCWIYHNGIGLFAKGGDVNGGVCDSTYFNGNNEDGLSFDYWGDPGDHCVYDDSLLGNKYIGCIVQGCSGFPYATLGPASSGTIIGCYLEGVGRKSPIGGNTQILGGTLSTGSFRLAHQDLNVVLSSGGPSIFADGVNRIASTSNHDTIQGVVMTVSLKENRQGGFFIKAENVESPGTNDDAGGYELVYGEFGGWYHWLHGNSQAVFGMSGSTASVGPGFLWFNRGYFLGGSLFHYHFSEDPEARSNVRSYDRYHGDITDRSDQAAVGKYYFRVNVTAGGGKFPAAWIASTAYALNDIVTPTEANATLNGRAFQATSIGSAPHHTGGSEPTWTDTLAATVSDGDITWTAIEGADFRPCGMIESGKSLSVDVSGGAHTLDITTDYVTVIAVGGGSVKLPASGQFEGKWFSIKAGGAFVVTIDGNGKNIDGGATYTQAANRECSLVRYNATTGEWELR